MCYSDVIGLCARLRVRYIEAGLYIAIMSDFCFQKKSVIYDDMGHLLIYTIPRMQVANTNAENIHRYFATSYKNCAIFLSRAEI